MQFSAVLSANFFSWKQTWRRVLGVEQGIRSGASARLS
jgi:hypothetical protein